MLKSKGKYFVGKVENYQKTKGWFFGHFMDEELLRSDDLEAAWQKVSNKKVAPEDRHYHKKAIEVNILISGSARFKINNEEVSVKKGDFWIIYPYAIVEDFETGPDTEIICIKAPSLKDDKFIALNR